MIGWRARAVMTGLVLVMFSPRRQRICYCCQIEVRAPFSIIVGASSTAATNTNGFVTTDIDDGEVAVQEDDDDGGNPRTFKMRERRVENESCI
jgi:hypothetical protein